MACPGQFLRGKTLAFAVRDGGAPNAQFRSAVIHPPRAFRGTLRGVSEILSQPAHAAGSKRPERQLASGARSVYRSPKRFLRTGRAGGDRHVAEYDRLGPEAA